MLWLLWLEGTQAASQLCKSAAPAHLFAAAATYQHRSDFHTHQSSAHTRAQSRPSIGISLMSMNESNN